MKNHLLRFAILALSITTAAIYVSTHNRQPVEQQPSINYEVITVVTDDIHSIDLPNFKCPKCGHYSFDSPSWFKQQHVCVVDCKNCGFEAVFIDTSLTLVGTVVEVDEVWTTNGDGGLMLSEDNGKLTRISVVGSPNDKETKVELRTIEYAQELVGFRIQADVWLSEDGTFKAKSIKEIVKD